MNEDPRQAFLQQSDGDTVKWVESLDPALIGLLKTAVVVEQGSAKPRGTIGTEELTPSQHLYSKDFDEFNRTSVSILSLNWLFNGYYDLFTQQQPNETKLSTRTFQEFRELAEKVLVDWDSILALIISLVLGDLGKSPDLQKQIVVGPAKGLNHDEVLEKAVEQGIVQRLLMKIPEPAQERLRKGIQLGAKLNIPQLVQGESVPGSLESINLLQGDKTAFEWKFLETMLDVCGAGGHKDARGAARMTEPVCRSFLDTRPILLKLLFEELTSVAAYNQILDNRGTLLVKKGFMSLTTEIEEERCILRMLSMGRVDNKDRAECYVEAFTNLPQGSKDVLVAGLNANGIGNQKAVILYYMPAVFATALKGAVEKQKTVAILRSLMLVMANIYRASQFKLGGQGTIVEQDVSFLNPIVQTTLFQHMPHVLDELHFPVSPVFQWFPLFHVFYLFISWHLHALYWQKY